MKRSFQFIQIGIMAGALSLVPAVAQTGSNPNSGSASGSAVSTPSNPNNGGGSTANASGNDTTTANPGSANPGTVA